MLLRRTVKSILYPLYERRLVRSLDFSQTPQHVGVIIDGNRRWAKENPDELGGTSAARGHRAGAQKIIEFLGWCEDVHVQVVTIWFLSTENFKRSEEELKTLLAIIGESVDELKATGRWKIKVVGSLELLPEWLREKLDVPTMAKPNSMVVNMAIGYGGRREIVDSVKRYLDDAEKHGLSIKQAAENLSADAIANFLYTAGQPDPELLIRTSGEQRLGGFLLWQSAHSEFYFCEAYWPDFRRVDFLRALRAYSLRHRRFGV
ncbi:MAG: isoprenyl transferase [Actinobacteria bacterium]|nr:isoprenyl transferase [Actinomycetota bacterium]